MKKILQLSDLVIDQIAAGEIIERPSSVVKELLENSIDSGADSISLRISDGGTARIEVTDNGEGINHEDLPLSIERHATSKMKSLADLDRISTHGFRGEALSAISSVSNLLIISRSINQNSGYRLEKVNEDWTCHPSPSRKGTTVIVEELFYKIPARKRFLKSSSTESSHCKNIFLKTALIHEGISWYFYNNEKNIVNLPTMKILQRFAKINDISVDMVNYIDEQIGPIKIKACLPFSNNEIRKKNHQFLYVNNRAVKDRTLIHAIKSALEDVTHGSKESGIMLSIDLPNQLVDFNVHPGKVEVRFKDNSAVYQAVLTTLKNNLNNPAGIKYTNEISSLGIQNKIASFKKKSLPDNSSSFQNPIQKSLGLESRYDSLNFEMKDLNNYRNINNSVPPLGFALAQLQGIYILSENSEGLVIVDMHAAHERILFEEYKKNVDEKNIKIQNLLNPIKIELDNKEAETVINNKQVLSSMGFIIFKIDSNSFSISGVPELAFKIDIRSIVHEIIRDLSDFGTAESYESKLKEFLGNVACKSAVKANKIMSLKEMNNLLRLMEKTDFGGKCNHGRPTWTQISLSNIDKIFMRGR
tara:strand:+ start:3021 stop:4781 length:1761 start_codon:yes stop_codon:yes gene_type:complete